MSLVSRFLLLIAAASWLASGSGQSANADPDAVFSGANRAFVDGRFADAEAGYRSLVNEGNVSAELFYNLGDAAYRQEKSGEAALWYRRALEVDPRFGEARQNLRVVKKKTGYLEFELKGVDAWLARLSPGELIAVMSAGLWIAVLIIAAVVVFRRLRDWRPLLWITSGIALAIASAAGWGLNRQRTALDAADLAIVTANGAAALTGPVPDAEKVVDIPPGSELQIIQRADTWTYVRIPQDLRGWVRTEDIAPVLWYGPNAVPNIAPGIASVPTIR